jgi:myo-inositol-hexaphosphate 3-phosphohydrolase
MMALCCMQVMAMQLVIEPQSGTDMQLDIARIGKWVFVHNELQLLDKAGNLLASEQINNMRKITFSDLTSDAENVPSENAIIVYPNPTQDVLIIQGVQAQVLRVYDMQGKLVITERGTQVHVSDLSNGIYLLQIGTQVVRFIKKD